MMKYHSHLWLVFLMGAGIFTVHAKDGDWQQWTELSWNQNLGNGLDVGLRSEFRFENDMDRFAYYEVEPMLNWRYSPRWDFFIAYERDERLRPEEDIMHVPNTGAVVKLRLKDWFLSNRFRMDFSIPESDSDFDAIYRNRSLVQYNGKWGAKSWSVYLFDEFFFSTSNGQLTENRVGVGLIVPIVPHWIGQIYFMRQDVRIFQGWEWHPVLGLQVQLQF